MWMKSRRCEARGNECKLFNPVCIQLILLTCTVNLISGNEHPPPKILIIGGGASGIAAASKLFENGFSDVTVLEAENRIGGRVHTIPLDGNLVDLGAQWVHGQKGNTVYELASPLGLLDDSVVWKYYDIFDSSGNRMDRNIVQNYHDHVMSKLEYLEQHNLSMSVGVYFEKELNEYFATHPEINETLKKEFFHFTNLWYVSNDAADSWYDLAADQSSTLQEYQGNIMVNWKERGYSTILDIVMKKIPNPSEELPVLNHTILNTEVKNINYENPEGTVKVVTTDGKEYLADHVIITTSLGVLKKQHKTLFKPPLPDAKVNSIKGLAYGNACKIWISFKEPWWQMEEDIRGFLPLWSEEDRKELEDNPYKNWLLDLTGFHVPAHKPHLMGGWFGAKGARMMEYLPDDLVFNETLNILHKFVGNHYNISEATGFARSKWYLNKHFHGTYSYHDLHTVESGATCETLSEPLMRGTKPVVLFGGEATNPRHYSTVQGAVESGFREAERIIKFYSKDSSTEVV